MTVAAEPRSRGGRRTAAWRDYACGSDVGDFARFCRDHLVQSVDEWDGEPLVLEAWQRRLFGEALAFDDAGRPIWRSVVICAPRKNGKTVMLAAYALFRLLTSDGAPEILLAASSDKQAGRLFDAAAAFVRRSPVLSEYCRVRDYIGEIARNDGEGKIFRLSSDPTRLHGYNPSLVVCDELGQWVTPSLRRAYAALTTGGGARRAPQVFTITTPGEARDRDDSILGGIIDGAVRDGDVEERPGLVVARHHAAQLLLYNFEAPTADPNDVRAMKLANPASWITVEFLAKQAANPELTPAQVLQLHGGVWAADRAQWLPAGAWRDCGPAEPAPPPPDGTPVVLGFDGSYKRDSTALVGSTLDGYVFVVAAWERPDTRDEWRVPRDDVDAAVDEAMKRWLVRELACDPPGWHREVEEWGERYGVAPAGPVSYFETNKRTMMAEACSRFYSAVTTGRLRHDGDPRLARHLSHAVTKKFGDNLLYITKDAPDSPRKIDLGVAAVVAYHKAMTLAERIPLSAWG